MKSELRRDTQCCYAQQGKNEYLPLTGLLTY